VKKTEYYILLSTLCAIGLQVAKTPAMGIAFEASTILWFSAACVQQILNYLKGEDK